MSSENKLPYDWAKNSVLSAIQPRAYSFFDQKAVTRELKTGDVIFEDGDPVTHAIFPHEGVLSFIAEMADGRTVEKSSIGNEGFVGLTLILGGGNALGRCVVQVPGKASWVSIEDLDVALERFECVREIMLRYAKSHTIQLMETAACNSLHTAEQRVVRWLLHAHDRVNGDTFYITQEVLANLLALRRATVNAISTDLMNARAIAYHRGSLTVVDRNVLKSYVCECYDRVRRASLYEATEV
ncbi:Crp/Fnr family transcriptional regulator [Rhizobium sp. KVB221]|uniref:Crp/Fnr family transcriptional regulator n=1 Tax=Rhizobium setariae TaxID=2801340 RepID=A0A937CR93_9HYPH|nr:Crp/Fnr family transcriptional regulator [Rhizobium setariae]MBL0375053.1 Crp/Fnr family transcriptional regulator [Rhizobium setariae]